MKAKFEGATIVVYRKKHKKVYDISNNFHGGLYLYLSKARNEKV